MSRPLAVAFGLSALLHALPFAAGLFTGRSPLPRPPAAPLQAAPAAAPAHPAAAAAAPVPARAPDKPTALSADGQGALGRMIGESAAMRSVKQRIR